MESFARESKYSSMRVTSPSELTSTRIMAGIRA
jgi:hypothetical protein